MEKEILEFDVIICGGGPGGSTCALGFKDSGLKVAVLEKSQFPREKVCGDGLAPYIPKALAKISPEYSKAFNDFKNKFPVPKVLVSSYDGSQYTIEFPESFFIASRYEFDNFLYELASSQKNISFFLNAQVTQVSVQENYAEVITQSGQIFRGKLVIGCDGATSVVRRNLTNFKINPSTHVAAVRGYYEGVTGVHNDTIELHFIKKFPVGYFWIFPSYGNSTNVGFGIPSETVTKHNVKLREEMVKIIEETPTLRDRFKNAKLTGDIQGWSIPLGYNSYPISGNRFMLAGDAASIADPASGEGIGLAMVSGRIAAFFAKNCFEKNNFSADFMKGYDVEMEKKFGKLLRKRAWIANMLGKFPWIMDVVITLIKGPKWFSNGLSRFILKFSQ